MNKMNPEEYYFVASEDYDFPGDYFWTVTRKDLWDKENRLSDRSEADHLMLQFDMTRLMESVYEPSLHPYDPKLIKKKLISAGFEYRPDLILSVDPEATVL